MTSARFNPALDLSALKQKAEASAAGNSGAAGYFVEVTSVEDFENLLRQSAQHPVVVEFTSSQAKGADQMSADLKALGEEAAGAYLVARVDVDAQREIAQALGVQGVPMVVGLLGGQLAPMFQGTQDKASIKAMLDQLVQAAAANGIVGKAKPVAGGAPAEGTEGAPKADPKYAAADEALERGDFAAAREEFEKILVNSPNDADAIAGKAQAGLYARAMTLDATVAVSAADADPKNLDAQLTAADAELMSGRAEAAFTRLIDVIRRTAGDERETARVRLLELFETLGAADPAVIKARRQLTSALF